ncbi:HNH endonuclease [Streptomyces mirabilis]|uniref:HNH endonuclease n=1 Tax=Streptomyces mirabilis TaxID=68239 RepID=UPI0033E36109
MASVACAEPNCQRTAVHRGFCDADYARLRRSGQLPLITPVDRLFAKIGEGPGGCWVWLGGRAGTGYGQFRWQGRDWPAHRVVYEFFIAEIPDGLDLDHLCRVRHCVNPWHMDPVTRRVNIIRGDAPKLKRAKTHCPRGHPYSDVNTYVYRGRRSCRACRRERYREVGPDGAARNSAG